jgi:uncharacterized protein
VNTTSSTSELASHRARLEHVFRETAKGNGRPFLDALSEDADWTITGTTGWSKTYRGKAAILAELIGPLLRVVKPPLRTHASRIIAEGDIVVVEARGANITRDGKPYENRYCYVFEFRLGEVIALTEYLDTDLLNTALGTPR